MTTSSAPDGASGADMYSSGEYLSHNPTWDAEQSGWKASQIAELCGEHGVRPSTCIEVGCGAGRILAELRMRWTGCTFRGFDPSPVAIGLAASSPVEGVTYSVGTPAESDRADLVVCADVIEHVEDHLGFLRSLRRHGSYFVFHVPLDMNVPGILFPSVIMRTRRDVGHLHYFGRETALATLESTGYAVVASRVTAGGVAFPSPGIAGAVARVLRAVAHRLSPVWASRLLGGYSLLVLAR